jgi:flagellin-like protein
MKNRKAMSEIITTIIMVVLALVAVAIIWGIISSVVSDKGAQAEINQKCLDVVLNVEGFVCSATSCTITITRAAGGDDFSGLKIVLKNSTSASEVIDSQGTIPQLGIVTKTVNSTVISNEGSVKEVEVTPYFNDVSGVAQICSTTASKNI